MKTSELKNQINQKYAWPGDYPMFLVMADGESICMDCGKVEWNNIVIARRMKDIHDDWYVAGVKINWEDPDLICCNCNEPIESAYAE
jgi:hypothetical protein